MVVIGLTGNIATGKSTVARMLAELGACVLDADLLAHEAMRPGTEVHRRIVARFGSGVLTESGEIHRPTLGALVFADPSALTELEGIVHPVVVEEIRRRLASCSAPVVVLEAIKLLEAQLHADCDVIWVVTSPRARQLERLMRLRGMPLEEAERRINAQPPQEQKTARADLVIVNDGSLEDLRRQVLAAWEALGRLKGASKDETGGR